jgi:redox-sensitive bicupin YhaK (pirin superfamily)
MIIKRPSLERGTYDHGWLKTAHTFSFGEYHDPTWMGFGSLRVMNEDWIAPGQGFPRHPHRNAEIVSLVLKGELSHQDSMGNSGTIRAGEIQYMSAGSGVTHSEFNASRTDPVHLIQIWMKPAEQHLPPQYAHRVIPPNNGAKSLLLVSGDAEDGAIQIRQDARISLIRLKSKESFTFVADPLRSYWVQVIGGEVLCNTEKGFTGDGFALREESEVSLSAVSGDSEVVLFDMR